MSKTMELGTEKPHWIAASSIRGAASRAPQGPGVYAIGRLRRVAGLPIEAEWVYVGRAIGALGLRGRLRAHEPVREKNEPLRAWLTTPSEGFEVWFAPTCSALEAIELEAALIETLQPAFNTVGNPARKTGRSNTRERAMSAVA